MSNQIVFTREIKNNAQVPVADIYTMNPDGTGLSRLTSNPPDRERDCAGPSWSPDSTKIAFMSYLRRPEVNTADIYVMDASGANITRITDGPGDNDGPVWSPDGGRIAFARDDGSGKMAIHLIDADGTHLQALTRSRYSDYAPAWSSSGIAFLRELSPFPQRLTAVFVINADGTGERQLTSTCSVIFDPTWSPDGSRIAFSAVIQDAVHWDIYSVDAATGAALVRHTTGVADDFAPCYSPSGTKIVLASNRDGEPKRIYVLDLASGFWVRLTGSPSDDGEPDWR